MITERTIYHAKQMGEANWRTASVVRQTLGKKPWDAAICHNIKEGFSADPPQFMKSLDGRVEKLTTHRQTKFFKGLAKILKKQKPETFSELNKKFDTLSFNSVFIKGAKEELDKLNYYTKRIVVLAKQNGVDLKRFLVK